MPCPSCGCENLEGMNFCGECGPPLTGRCQQCGFEKPPRFKFCGDCGAPLSIPAQSLSPAPLLPPSVAPISYTPTYLAERIVASLSPLEGERMQITVLFAELKGSMEVLPDPEEARQFLNLMLECMMAAVHRYEGTVNQVIGDGIMALSKAPLAHEDHAARACYAALAMQAALRRYSDGVRRMHGLPVDFRIGLNSGEVVVRAIENDLYMDYSAIRVAITNQETGLQVLANEPLGTVYQAQGDYRRVADCLGQTVMLLDGAQRRKLWGQVFLPVVHASAWLTACYAELVMLAEAIACGDAGLWVAAAVDRPGNLMIASWGIGVASLRQGKVLRALPSLAQAVALCQDADLPSSFPW